MPSTPSAGARLAVRVTKDAERQVRSGHPWVFDHAVVSVKGDGAPGDLAVIFDDRRRFVAIGLYDPTSPIRIRVLHHGSPLAIDELFWYGRMASAVQRRRLLAEGGHTTAYRVVYGESDGLPGVVVDRYSDVYVVKLYAASTAAHLASVLDAVVAALSPATVVLRRARSLGGDVAEVVHGQLASPVVRYLENGLTFEADVCHGQKTGAFLDQRENRAQVRALAGGASVLDVFANTGGFSVHAAAGGATRVVSVDSSEAALTGASRNMALNRSRQAVRACQHETITGDAFAVMADLARRRAEFDIVIVDPPSFAHRQRDVARAVASYGRLTQAACALVREGGTLVQASCSSHVTADRFSEAVVATATANGHRLEEVRRTGHPTDHPVGFPEAAYLKAVFARVRHRPPA